MRLYLGIDPGLSGAIALVDEGGCLERLADMPLVARGRGRVRMEVDAGGLLELLRLDAKRIAFGIVELVGAMPHQGVASMFSLGHSFGTATTVAAGLRIPFEVLPAAKWKRLAELPADKGLVLAAARRRWPHAPLALARHSGRAESLFLALLAARRVSGVGTPR